MEDASLRFQALFRNLTSMPSQPVRGQMSSQEFGVYLPNFGEIGTFNLPPLQPDSFFDVS